MLRRVMMVSSRCVGSRLGRGSRYSGRCCVQVVSGTAPQCQLVSTTGNLHLDAEPRKRTKTSASPLPTLAGEGCPKADRPIGPKSVDALLRCASILPEGVA